MRRPALFLAALTLIGACSQAQASPINFGLDPSLNLLVLSNMNVSSSDVEGRVAVGGNASLSSYSINTKTGASALYAGTGLTVGGNLNFSSGSVWGGAAIGGGYAQSASGTVLGGVSTGSTGGFDFAGERLRLNDLSVNLDLLANTGSATDQWGTLHFDASGKMLAVFDISASDALKSMQIDSLLDGAQVLINVHGSSVDFGNHGYTGFNKGQVVFNLPEAASVLLNGGINASLLATQATVGMGWGQINGQVVVNNWNSSVQVNDAPLPGARAPAPVNRLPEPESLALMGAALAALAWVRRRRA
jgi:choice-of-anchor A domain-containing protein